MKLRQQGLEIQVLGSAAPLGRALLGKGDTTALLDSQFATLQVPTGEPGVLTLDATAPLQQLQAEVTARMEAAAALKVPLLVECGVGGNWDEAH